MRSRIDAEWINGPAWPVFFGTWVHCAVDSNLPNRYVHLTLFAPCDAAGAFKGHPGPMPKAPTAAQLLDTGKHIQLAANVLVDRVDETDISLHDEHKTSHLVTQTFTAADIELVARTKSPASTSKNAPKVERGRIKRK